MKRDPGNTPVSRLRVGPVRGLRLTIPLIKARDFGEKD